MTWVQGNLNLRLYIFRGAVGEESRPKEEGLARNQKNQDMATLKPNKPKTYDGKRDEYEVRTWIFQVTKYLNLVLVGMPNPLPDPTKISFAATYLSGTASTWWYTRVASNTIPATWAGFEASVVQEFVPFDSGQRARDKLRKLFQRTSVSAYLSEFRNITLAIPGITEGEKVDRFVQGLKPRS